MKNTNNKKYKKITPLKINILIIYTFLEYKIIIYTLIIYLIKFTKYNNKLYKLKIIMIYKIINFQ